MNLRQSFRQLSSDRQTDTTNTRPCRFVGGQECKTPADWIQLLAERASPFTLSFGKLRNSQLSDVLQKFSSIRIYHVRHAFNGNSASSEKPKRNPRNFKAMHWSSLYMYEQVVFVWHLRLIKLLYRLNVTCTKAWATKQVFIAEILAKYIVISNYTPRKIIYSAGINCRAQDGRKLNP